MSLILINLLMYYVHVLALDWRVNGKEYNIHAHAGQYPFQKNFFCCLTSPCSDGPLYLASVILLVGLLLVCCMQQEMGTQPY